jgi:hypothetical protein
MSDIAKKIFAEGEPFYNSAFVDKIIIPTQIIQKRVQDYKEQTVDYLRSTIKVLVIEKNGQTVPLSNEQVEEIVQVIAGRFKVVIEHDLVRLESLISLLTGYQHAQNALTEPTKVKSSHSPLNKAKKWLKSLI